MTTRRILIVALVVLTAVAAAFWMKGGTTPDAVDSSAKVPRGTQAPTTPDPEIEKLRQMLDAQKKK